MTVIKGPPQVIPPEPGLRDRVSRKLASAPTVRSAPSVNYRAIVHAHV